MWFSLIFYFLGTLTRFLGRLVSGLSCSLFHLAAGFLGGTLGGATSLFDVALCSSLVRLIRLGENPRAKRSARTHTPRTKNLMATPHTAVLRPLSKLTIRTTTAITSNRWIRLPATWKLKPNSHRISRITKIVQSILVISSSQTPCNVHR